jgi:hypothetical protein
VCSVINYKILSRVYSDYIYMTGIGLTTGFIGSHSYTQLQCIHSYNSLALQLTLYSVARSTVVAWRNPSRDVCCACSRARVRHFVYFIVRHIAYVTLYRWLLLTASTLQYNSEIRHQIAYNPEPWPKSRRKKTIDHCRLIINYQMMNSSTIIYFLYGLIM